MNSEELPVPGFYQEENAGKVLRVDYQRRFKDGRLWAAENNIRPSSEDKFKICLLAVDMQNTFCTPGYELFVAGRSGNGAVDDTKRLCEFVYKNLNVITEIYPTLDTHQPIQIFHSIFLANDAGEHPAPYTLITHEDVKHGVWKINADACRSLSINPEYAQEHLLHYTSELKERGKYNLTVWPYHAMLGSSGYALASLLEEAVFFHSVTRYSQPQFQVKGRNPLTEHYSIFGPEVKTGAEGRIIGKKNTELIERLLGFDAIIIAGQAKSHCVAWTIEDLLDDLSIRQKHLTEKIYLLEDCTSPVVIPGVIDYTEEANEAFRRFSEAGMHVVKSTTPIRDWPGINVLESQNSL